MALSLSNVKTFTRPTVQQRKVVLAPCSALKSSIKTTIKPKSIISKATAEIVMPVGNLDDEARTKLAEQVGFRSIGKELPDNVTLTQIIKSLPAEVFELDHKKAWTSVAITVTALFLGLYLIHISPWYLLPFAWAYTGTALTGWFVVGHDCGHRAFHRNKLVEDIVGHIMFFPLIYPFEPWRIKHNHHHAHTNKLVEDTAWHPIMEEEMENLPGFYKLFLGSPLKLFASIGHWWIWHFNVNRYTEKQRPRVLVSLANVAAFLLIALPLLFKFGGIGAIVKYWLMPWLGYHFWMSTITVIHHTAAHIPFMPAKEWNAAKAQLSGTVHCDYPKWVEFLCFDINVHVPHHVCSKIPWYNLRAANDSLRKNWGEYMTECTLNWRMLKYIFTELHVYDRVKNYKPFDFKKEEPMFAIQRKFLPDSM
uniref:Fatty acid desaturase domain-containing protein n=2 Tax=Polytomella parva TaxID=51329 RepID=A0A7S0YAH9_9CHLO|nr:omega-6-FAd, chloroplast isoform (O6F) [Polytomella parva]|mmetsp:Transcript_13368/g.23669  ORF Transcript_13368/g.23669 Transcript_13368/m.23669 type:complete len:421 (+) Transcript_13368:132-1394(+)|eukprot:CAMPEP_0175045660 /NCGR_PEP_ID=MMETSP0052_2-20121109/4564_1 /TAXON_ID=51329 ORGANISM="Polytomella parva, Strain SAG 63-3" /NCGR_SAMPLE_ID=MMETSP0052_2 /ASSEMBLY_ACC=CAM_ASM_000194 /LENGTH=420 /DNA_ID=CAMNT_0016309251 /DNA_START=103 /DNA_END=1365 /DNA_ORIENTATION=-